MKKKKDIFSYVLRPKISEFRKESCIDKLYDIENIVNKNNEVTLLENPQKYIKNFLISDSIKNYRNEILMAKIQHMSALNYYNKCKTLDRNSDEYKSTEFLCKIYLEDVIVKLYSSYDKSYHILNTVLNLKVNAEIEKYNYKKCIREKIKEKDKKLYEKINSIFSRLQDEKYLSFRDNIIHNESQSFIRIYRDYNIENVNLKVEKAKTTEEIIEIIEQISNILEENLNIINGLIQEDNHV